MQIGYARVSTKDQHLDLQLDALKSAGCETIFSEIASGATAERHELTKLLAHVRQGDVIVIWKLDRLGRSLPHLVDVVTTLMAKGVGLKSLQDPLDTTTAQGRLVFNLFASLAEFERDLIRERTQAGLHAARARGRLGGRPKGLSAAAAKKAIAVAALYKEGKLSVSDIARNQGISKATLYSYLPHRGVQDAGPAAEREEGGSLIALEPHPWVSRGLLFPPRAPPAVIMTALCYSLRRQGVCTRRGAHA